MSAFVKSQLKAAREAIAAKNFEYAESTCNDVLENDPGNYTALVFRGLALLSLERTDESLRSYEAAVAAAPSQPLAYQGMLKLFESTQDQRGVLSTLTSLLPIYIEAKDAKKALETVQRQISIHLSDKNRAKAIQALKQLLPGSPVAALAPPDLPPPIEIWRQIAELREADDAETITREYEIRRRRLGTDTPAVIRLKVEREVMLASDMDQILEHLIELDSDAQRSAAHRSRLLQVLSRKLPHLPSESKEEVCSRVDNLARSLVDDGVADPHALETLIESENEPLESRDEDRISVAAAIEQECPIVLFSRAFIIWKSGESTDEAVRLIKNGLKESASSVFAYAMLSRIYYDNADWESTAAAAEKCRDLAAKSANTLARDLSNVHLQASIYLGEAYVHQGHRTVSQALLIFKSILQAHNSNVDALTGLGLALASIGKHDEAARCFDKILRIDADNQRATIELAWVDFQRGDYAAALERLESADLRETSFLVKYRLAHVHWTMPEGNLQLVYSLLIEAARLNPRYAPTFTLLGKYYLDANGDTVRAAKCFLKAISIDSNDEDASQSLALLWLEQSSSHSDEDSIFKAQELLKEFTANMPRAIWAWKLWGIIALARDKHEEAINCFQTALRIDAEDALLWTSLGEAYSLQGKYMAALKALDRALEISPESAHAVLLKAGVHQKLVMYPEAIKCYEACLAAVERDDQADPLAVVPALRGLAETLLHYARALYEDGGYGACAARLLEAVRICGRIISLCPDSEGAALILGDASLAAALLVPDIASPDHATALDAIASESAEAPAGIAPFDAPSAHGLSDAQADTLMRILRGAAWAYHRALALAVDHKQNAVHAAAYSHNLSVAYFHASKLAASRGSGDESSRVLGLAIRAVKVALRIHPDKALYWNALGVYTCTVDPKICQHALIKAAELDTENPCVWCNLGFFYVMQDDLDLAGQCFQRAQFADPDWALAWFGQGYVADVTGSKDSFDLYEHAYTLGNTSHYDILYSYGLECFKNPQRTASTLLQASHCLLKCVERRPADPAAFNLYGLVLERQGLHEAAIDAFAAAIRLLEQAREDASSRRLLAVALENKARVECAGGRFSDSFASFSAVLDLGQPTDAFTLVGQGLAAYFVGDLSASLHAFEKALAMCAGAEGDSAADAGRLKRLGNDTTLLLSQVLYALGTPEHIELAKQQLLQCIAADAQYVPAIISLAALGLVLQDWTLAQTAAAELLKLEPEVLGPFDSDADRVLAVLFSVQGQIKTARRFMCKAVHRFPWKAERWSRLAEQLLRHEPAASAVASTVAASALSVFEAASPDPLNPVTTAQVTDMQRAGGLAQLSDGNPRSRRRARAALCKAIRSAPSNASNWLALGLHQCAETVAAVSGCPTIEEPRKRPLDSLAYIAAPGDGAETGIDEDVFGDRAPLSSDDTAHLVDRLADSVLALVGSAAGRATETAEWAHLLKAEALVQRASATGDAGLAAAAAQHADAVIGATSGDSVRKAGYVVLGRALRAAGDPATAGEAFNKAAAIDGGAWTAPLDELAAVYDVGAMPSEAEMAHQAALALLGGQPQCKLPILDRLAWLHVRSNNLATASERINEALQLDPTHPLARYLQTLVMVRSGKTDGGSKGKLAKNMGMLRDMAGDAASGITHAMVEQLSA
ncbi:Superkiller protein 3 [Polyrhizophydium stewartii]|uniref:Superkiller protein 3 n=1 Tax=Polyrhizophydium stewartii TaxID=2732419 RepID=A0ABR4NCK9_9FUNG